MGEPEDSEDRFLFELALAALALAALASARRASWELEGSRNKVKKIVKTPRFLGISKLDL